MRLLRPLAVLVLLLSASRALAYEGAGRIQDEQAPAPKKQPPKLTKAPKRVKAAEAPYPPELLKLKPPPSGLVRLLITLSAEGKVTDVKLIRSSGYPSMDASAMTAMRQFLFTPAELDGKPAAIRLEYDFKFEPPPPPPAPVANGPRALAPVNFRGRVLERGTRDPLVGATVYLPASGLHAETDKDGRFEIHGAPIGKDRVDVKEANHRTFLATETIKPGRVIEVTYYLWKKIEGEFEITVRGQREKEDVSERTLQSAELTTVPGSYGDPIRVLEDMPGVARTPYGIGALLVRGSNPGDTQTLIDGVPVPLLFHFAGGPSVINPSFVGGVNFYPGAFGARYGRAIAGIVDVWTKAANPTNYHGDISIDLIQSSFYLEGPISKTHNWGTLEIAARRSYLDLWLPTLLKLVETPGQATIIASPVYWDYQARYSINLGRHHFELSAFGSDDQVAVSQAGTVQTQGFDVYEHQAFHKVRAKYTTTEDGWQFSVLPSAGPAITSGAGTFSGNTIGGTLTDWNLNLRAFGRKNFLKNLAVEAGLELNADLNTINFHAPEPPAYLEFPGEDPNTPYVNVANTANLAEQAVYAEVNWNPWGGLRVIPGIRFENYVLPATDVPSVEPRMSARYEFSEGTAFKAGWGIYREPPPPQDLAKGYGTPTLGLQESQQTVFGVEQQITPQLSADVEGYYNWRDHLIAQEAGTSTRAFDNSGRGYVYGLEVLIKQELTRRMFGWISYTLSRSVIYDSISGGYVPYSFDETHILTVVASYKFDFGIQAGLRFQLATGTPTTPTTGSTFDADQQEYNAYLGPEGTSRLPTFNQLDIRVEKLWTFPQWTFSLYLDVQNIYNAPNEEAILYNFNYSQYAYLRGLPILPTLGVSGHF